MDRSRDAQVLVVGSGQENILCALLEEVKRPYFDDVRKPWGNFGTREAGFPLGSVLYPLQLT